MRAKLSDKLAATVEDVFCKFNEEKEPSRSCWESYPSDKLSTLTFLNPSRVLNYFLGSFKRACMWPLRLLEVADTFSALQPEGQDRRK